MPPLPLSYPPGEYAPPLAPLDWLPVPPDGDTPPAAAPPPPVTPDLDPPELALPPVAPWPLDEFDLFFFLPEPVPPVAAGTVRLV